MKPFIAGFSIRAILTAVVGAFALTCASAPLALAQHGGGGHVGSAHVGSAPHVATPHVSAPGAAHPAASRPTILYLPPSAGARTPVMAGPVRLIPPPGTVRPLLGSGAMPPVVAPLEPHTVIGFPPTGTAGSAPLHFSSGLSFFGQGHEIWQDSANPARSIGRGSTIGAGPIGGRMFPRRPRFPIFPIFGPPAFGFFGSPFFGLGLGFGFNALWWPSCGPYWGWGYGCNGLSSYDYGPGYGYGGYSPNSLEGEVESEAGPQIYENAYPNYPIYNYGDGVRELVQLYLKDGTIYYVTDYWLVNDQLHFTTVEEGGTKSVEHVIDFDQLDLQKTIDENSAHGFRFVLRNEPIEQYLQDYPDAGAPNRAPDAGPAGPLPSAPPQSGIPQSAQPQQAPAPR